jgi:drug/metabolite transporter (DMT)-like permease
MNGSQQRLLWPSLAVALAAVVWGTTWIPLRQIAAPGIPPGWNGVLIYVLPAILSLPLVLARYRAVRRGGWPLMMVGLAAGTCNGLFAIAISQGEVGMIVLLFYLSPIWATLLERAVLGTPIARIRWVSVALGLVGMVVLQGLAGRWPLPSNVWEWMGLFAGLFWAVALVAANVARESTIVDKTALQFIFAALAGLAVILILDSQSVGDGAWPSFAGILATWPWILVVAALWIVPAMAFSLWGASRMSPARASMLLMLEAVVGLFSAVLIGGEELGVNKVISGALILAASLVDALGSAQTDQKAATAVSGDTR